VRQDVRAVTGDSDPGFELCFLDADGDERRELPAAWPGLWPETFMPVREFRWARDQKHLSAYDLVCRSAYDLACRCCGGLAC